MKLLIKSILPITVFVLASAAAVKINELKNIAAKDVLIIGWIHSPDSSHCLAREVDCSTINNAQICTVDIDNKQVYGKSSNGQCNILLYKINH